MNNINRSMISPIWPDPIFQMEFVVGDPIDVRGVPLQPWHIRTYILQIPDRAEAYRRRELVDFAVEQHRLKGGLDSVSDPTLQTKKALKELVDHGLLEHVSNGFYRKTGKTETLRADDEFMADHGLPPLKMNQPKQDEKKETETLQAELEIGSGSEVVYGWYFPTYKELAGFKDQETWPIKIGRSESDSMSRIMDSIGQSPEKPVLAFLHHVDDSRESEKWYHISMKVRGKHIDHSIGDEWFVSNPSELLKLGEELENHLATKSGVSNDT